MSPSENSLTEGDRQFPLFVWVDENLVTEAIFLHITFVRALFSKYDSFVNVPHKLNISRNITESFFPFMRDLDEIQNLAGPLFYQNG